jgi:hypothetical protein
MLTAPPDHHTWFSRTTSIALAQGGSERIRHGQHRGLALRFPKRLHLVLPACYWQVVQVVAGARGRRQRLGTTEGHLEGSIHDNGWGFSPGPRADPRGCATALQPTPRIERVRVADGTLTITSSPG